MPGALPRRAGASSLVLLLLCLAARLPAQVRGISVTPHMFDWHQLSQGNMSAWFSTPRFGKYQDETAENNERIARRVVGLGGPILKSLRERTGIELHYSGATLTDILPADRTLQRFRYSQGGVSLFYAPDDWARLGLDRWIQREVGTQLGQAFMWKVLNRHKIRNPVRKYLVRRLPPVWFLLGMGAYLGTEPLAWERQLLRASLGGDRKPLPLGDLLYAETMSLVSKEEAYQQARDFCGWLARREGAHHAVKYLDLIRRDPLEPGETFREHFGLNFTQAKDLWMEDFRAREEKALAGWTPHPEKRRVTRLKGWGGALSPSPDGEKVAVAVNRRYNHGRLMDLTVVNRFGAKSPRFMGGNPIIGSPAWLPDGRILAIEETIRPFGQRVHKIVVRSLREAPGRRFRGLPILRDIRAAVRTGGRLFARTVGQTRAEVIYEGEVVTEIGVAPSGRWLSALAWPGGKPTLFFFDLPEVLAEVEDEKRHDPIQPVYKRPLPEGYDHRWTENADRLLFLRHDSDGTGTQVCLMDPATGDERVLTNRPGLVRNVFGSLGRVFFVEDMPGAVDRLVELHPPTGRTRGIATDAYGILAARPTEGMRWVSFASLHPEGPQLCEIPLPPAEIPAPGEEDLRLPEPTLAAKEDEGLAGELVLGDWDGDSDGQRLTSVSGVVPVTAPVKPYKPRYLKRNDSYVLDEDSIGLTFEWRDAFNHRSIQGAAWLGDSIHRGNYQALYYNNRRRPAWFAGAFDADREDLLGMFPLSDFNAAVAQRGLLAGVNYQGSPFHNYTFFMEGKKLEFDPSQFVPRTADPEPDMRKMRLQWTLNELAASPDAGNNPIGSRLLQLSLGRAGFEGDAKFWELIGDWRTYHPMSRASDSFATRFLFAFRNPDQDPSPVPLDFALGGPETLRGIQPGFLVGEKFIQTTFELRRLLTNRKGMKRSLSKVGLDKILDPLRFDRIYAAVFLDMGTAYTDHFEWGRVERSIGVELRAQGFLTAFRDVSFRLGFAHGFGPIGQNDVYFVTSSVF